MTTSSPLATADGALNGGNGAIDHDRNDHQRHIDEEDDRRQQRRDMTIDPARQRYPYCILWSPLPPITWCFPFVGHTGISNSHGVIYDFAGPYTIGKQHMAFGPPTRYIQLDPSLCRDMDWDAAVEQGCEIYSQRMHNICCDNCHSHVAQCLNLMGYNNKKTYKTCPMATFKDPSIYVTELGVFGIFKEFVKDNPGLITQHVLEKWNILKYFWQDDVEMLKLKSPIVSKVGTVLIHNQPGRFIQGIFGKDLGHRATKRRFTSNPRFF